MTTHQRRNFLFLRETQAELFLITRLKLKWRVKYKRTPQKDTAVAGLVSRKLLSDIIITNVPTTNVGVLVRKPLTFPM